MQCIDAVQEHFPGSLRDSRSASVIAYLYPKVLRAAHATACYQARLYDGRPTALLFRPTRSRWSSRALSIVCSSFRNTSCEGEYYGWRGQYADTGCAVDVTRISTYYQKAPTRLCNHVESVCHTLELHRRLNVSLKYHTTGLYDFSGGKDNRGQVIDGRKNVIRDIVRVDGTRRPGTLGAANGGNYLVRAEFV